MATEFVEQDNKWHDFVNISKGQIDPGRLKSEMNDSHGKSK